MYNDEEPKISSNRCSNCKSELAENAIFCAECGTKVKTTNDTVNTEIVSKPKKTEKFCTNCGAKNDIAATTCSSCNTPFLVQNEDSKKSIISTEQLKNIKVLDSIKQPSKSVGKICLVAIAIIIGVYLIYNGIVSNKIEYVLYKTNKQFSNELKNAVVSNKHIENTKSLVNKSFDFDLYTDDTDLFSGSFQKSSNEYNLNVSNADSQIEADFTYDKKNNSIIAIITGISNNEISFEITQKNANEIFVEALNVEDKEIITSVSYTITDFGVQLKDGKLVFDKELSNELLELQKDYQNQFVELAKKNQIDVKKSSEKGVDKEFILDIKTKDYKKLMFNYIKDYKSLIIENSGTIEATDYYGSFGDLSEATEYAEETFKNAVDDFFDQLIDEINYNIPDEKFELIIKTKNNKIKGIEAEDYLTLDFNNTDKYLDNEITLVDEYGDEIVSNISINKNSWSVEFSVEENGKLSSADKFFWDLKTGDGVINHYDSYYDEYKDIYDFNYITNSNGLNMKITDTEYDNSLYLEINTK